MKVGMYDTWSKVMQPVLCIIMHYHTLPAGDIHLNVSPGNILLVFATKWNAGMCLS